MNAEFTMRLQKIEGVLNAYLPTQSDGGWRNFSFGSIAPCVNDSHFSNLISPCRSLIDSGGKRWRPLLLVLCAELSAVAKNSSQGSVESSLEKAYGITPLVEFAHTASLIHDDIEDSSDTRRGNPASHITYGLDVALNAASWLYFEAAASVGRMNFSDSEKVRFYELFLTELRRLHLGQAMDILWHRNPDLIPSVQEYTAMVQNKTGTLSRLAVKLGFLSGGASDSEIEEAGSVAQNIGTGFQILDDVINLTAGNPGKKRGDDIVEGKKSLPVLIHLEKNPQDAGTLASLFKKARDEGIESPSVEEAISILTKSSAIDEARAKGIEIVAANSEKLADFFGTGSSKAGLLINELLASLQEKAR